MPYKTVPPQEDGELASNKRRGFGLIIIGSEILDGRIKDLHFDNFRKIIRNRNHFLSYSTTIIDSPELIREQLQWSFNRPEPFFCCGGIGATPDDHTRKAAADVVGVPLTPHPEACRIIEDVVSPHRRKACLEMGYFPRGAELIPNPVNKVPGFSIKSGFFLPGFPRMAESMAVWIMDTYFKKGARYATYSLRLPGSREADLVDLMRLFVSDFPDLLFSSLPRFVPDGFEVIITLQGPHQRLAAGAEKLTEELGIKKLNWEQIA